MKKKIVFEFPLQCTPGSLYRAMTTSVGLEGWFADRVVVSGDCYEFVWNKVSQNARLVHAKNNAYVRYQWEDPREHYFELRISHQELTGDILLTVTDFADAADADGCRSLWEAHVDKLKRAIGCPKK